MQAMLARSFSLVFFTLASFFPLTVRPAHAFVTLSVEMTDFPRPVGPGAILVYDIELVNDGDEGAEDVVVESAVPAGTVFFSASDGGAPGAGNSVVWNIGSLPGPSSKTVTLRVEVEFPSPPNENIVNAVLVTASNAAPVSDGTLTPVQPLGIDMTVDTSPEDCLGSPFRVYKIRFSNGSTGPMADLKLIGGVPPGTVLSSAALGGEGKCCDTGEGCSASAPACSANSDCSGGVPCVAFWDIGTVSSGEQGFRVYTVRVEDTEPAGATFESSAELTNGLNAAADTAPTTTIEDLPCPLLEKTDLGPLTVEPGGRIQYRITVVNAGRTAATGSEVSDPLPTGTDFGTAGPASCGGTGPVGVLGVDEVVRWDLGDVDPEEEVIVCLEVDVKADNPVPTVVNTASFSDVEGDDISDIESTAVRVATALKLTKDAEPSPVEPGEQVTYAITFQNNADFTVTGVEISDDLTNDLTPAGCASFSAVGTAACGGDVAAVEAGGVVTWALGSVVPSGVVAVCLVVDILNNQECDEQVLRNVARVRDDRGEETTATARTRMRFPGSGGAPPVPLRLLKTAPGQRKVKAGGDVVYTLEVRNRTDEALLDVTVTDDLDQVTPAGALTFVSASASACAGTGPDGILAGNTVTWSFPSLPPGGQTVCLRARASADLGNGDVIRNVAEAVDAGNDTAEDSVTTEVLVKALRVRILDLDDPVQQGGQIRYAISVDNLGDVSLGDAPGTERVEKVMVVTRVPSGTTLDCISGSPTIDCAPPAEGVTLVRDPSVKGRRAIWTLDEPLGTLVGENSRTMKMEITVTEKSRRVRAQATAREYTLGSKSRSRALTVVEENR